eukprot:RCo000508
MVCSLFVEDFLELKGAHDGRGFCRSPGCQYGNVGLHPRRQVKSDAPGDATLSALRVELETLRKETKLTVGNMKFRILLHTHDMADFLPCYVGEYVSEPEQQQMGIAQSKQTLSVSLRGTTAPAFMASRSSFLVAVPGDMQSTFALAGEKGDLLEFNHITQKGLYWHRQ